jgi:hypothetical protein
VTSLVVGVRCSFRGKDAGSVRIRSDTGAPEDAGSGRAARAHGSASFRQALLVVLPLLVALAVLAGCGEEQAGSGTATLWVTRDRGAEVIHTSTVPAGISVLEAVDRELDVETRYGGRFVQAIEDLEGSVGDQEDWFWYVNGLEGDRSAAEYRLRPGEIAWWDYRSWAEDLQVPVVIGAFPEPFLHGFDGHVPPAVVVGNSPAATRLARLLGGRVAERAPPGANVLRIVAGHGLSASRSGDRVVFTLGAEDAPRLADEPSLARYRFEGLP